ncbi:hypothetical protein AB5N19_08074 [Seiridium cardinale]
MSKPGRALTGYCSPSDVGMKITVIMAHDLPLGVNSIACDRLGAGKNYLELKQPCLPHLCIKSTRLQQDEGIGETGIGSSEPGVSFISISFTVYSMLETKLPFLTHNHYAAQRTTLGT